MTVLAWAGPVLALTKEERLILWVGVLAGVLVLGGVFIARVDRWRKRQMEHLDETPTQMTSFREMYESGEISREEYDRVLRRMAERVGAKPRPVQAPAVPPEPEPPATQEPPPPPA
jgi:hypothetical protein